MLMKKFDWFICLVGIPCFVITVAVLAVKVLDSNKNNRSENVMASYPIEFINEDPDLEIKARSYTIRNNFVTFYRERRILTLNIETIKLIRGPEIYAQKQGDQND